MHVAVSYSIIYLFIVIVINVIVLLYKCWMCWMCKWKSDRDIVNALQKLVSNDTFKSLQPNIFTATCNPIFKHLNEILQTTNDKRRTTIYQMIVVVNCKCDPLEILVLHMNAFHLFLGFCSPNHWIRWCRATASFN